MLNYTRIRLETEVDACRSQLETLRSTNATLTPLLARVSAVLSAQSAVFNKSLSSLQHRLETWTYAAWIGATVGAAAEAAVTALVFRRRK